MTPLEIFGARIRAGVLALLDVLDLARLNPERTKRRIYQKEIAAKTAASWVKAVRIARFLGTSVDELTEGLMP